MADVDAIIFTHHFTNFDNLGGINIGIGWIDQGIGHADRAILHRLGHTTAHEIQFSGRTLPHCHTLSVGAQGATPQKGANVGGNPVVDHSM